MKFYSEDIITELHPEIHNALVTVRADRGFSAGDYVNKKTAILNDYMARYNLKTCVIAISGGIDSAVVYAIASKAKEQPNSPIEKIVPIFLPVYKSEGATNQESARNKADELVRTFSGDDVVEIDISPVHRLLKETVDHSMGLKGEAWASGQLVSYLRTPTYYYVTSLMKEQDKSAIICGTTNRDEGAYLGYFGKASDGMVDVQVISDAHKSEVYAVAKYLGVPDSIIEAVPTGDMYDNRSDVEVFGAPYDFVELYVAFLGMIELQQNKLLRSLSQEAKKQFDVLAKNLEDLHRFNKHKYLSASPAVHLDVIQGQIEGGWQYNNYEGDFSYEGK